MFDLEFNAPANATNENIKDARITEGESPVINAYPHKRVIMSADLISSVCFVLFRKENKNRKTT